MKCTDCKWLDEKRAYCLAFERNISDTTIRADWECSGAKPKQTYVMIRTTSAGVFCGWLKHRDGKEVCLTDARRIWYWSGAATLSELAVCGTKDPEHCKIPVAVPEIVLTEAVEIIPMTDEAIESLGKVPVWKA